jgi:hypothetical protein
LQERLVAAQANQGASAGGAGRPAFFGFDFLAMNGVSPSNTASGFDQPSAAALGEGAWSVPTGRALVAISEKCFSLAERR